MTANRDEHHDRRQRRELQHPYRAWDRMIAPFRHIGRRQRLLSPPLARSLSQDGPDCSPAPEIVTTLQSTEPVADEDDVNQNEGVLPEAIGATMEVDTAQSLTNDSLSDSDMIANMTALDQHEPCATPHHVDSNCETDQAITRELSVLNEELINCGNDNHDREGTYQIIHQENHVEAIVPPTNRTDEELVRREDPMEEETVRQEDIVEEEM
ncbi:hypothetical protein CY34DRAFT_19723, partial [Suillus luteus UH-Slu-Lm8-n1]